MISVISIEYRINLYDFYALNFLRVFTRSVIPVIIILIISLNNPRLILATEFPLHCFLSS